MNRELVGVARAASDRERWNARVTRAARTWIGTPYRHQGSRIGVGCDCLGLVRGVWRVLLGPEPESVPAYEMGWAEMRADEPLLEAARRVLVPATDMPALAVEAELHAGTVIVFRWSSHAAAKHCGIASGPDRFIHAYAGNGVVESPLVPSWRRRIAQTFLFPLPGTHTAGPADLTAREATGPIRASAGQGQKTWEMR